MKLVADPFTKVHCIRSELMTLREKNLFCHITSREDGILERLLYHFIHLNYFHFISLRIRLSSKLSFWPSPYAFCHRFSRAIDRSRSRLRCQKGNINE